MLGGGGDSHYVGRSVDGSKPDMTGKQKAGRNEGVKDAESRSLALFLRTILILLCCILVCLFVLLFVPFILAFFSAGRHLSSLIVRTPAFQWLSCTLAEL